MTVLMFIRAGQPIPAPGFKVDASKTPAEKFYENHKRGVSGYEWNLYYNIVFPAGHKENEDYYWLINMPDGNPQWGEYSL